MSKEVMIRFAISSAVTFITAFGLAILPMVGDVAFDKAAIFGLIVVGARAGVKALSESLGYKG